MKDRLFLLLLGCVFLLPPVVLAVYAVAPGWRFPDVLPGRFDGAALRYIASQGPEIAHHMLSSVGYSLCTVFLTLVLCAAPAELLARHSFRGRETVEALLLAPALVPVMTFSMGIHFLFIKAGLTDSVLGVILVLTVFSYPYMLRALIAGYQVIGRDYVLCAANLGAGRREQLLRVELPLLLPSVIAGGSVVFLVAFSEYFLVFLIGGGSVHSYTGYLFPFLTSSNRAAASVLTLLFLIPPVVLFLFVDATVVRIYRKKGMY